MNDAENFAASRGTGIRVNELIFRVKKDHRLNFSFISKYQELVVYLVKNNAKLTNEGTFPGAGALFNQSFVYLIVDMSCVYG